MIRRAILLSLACVMAFVGGNLRSEEAAAPATSDDAVVAVEAQQAVEATMLAEDLERLDRVSRSRAGVEESLDALYRAQRSALRDANAEAVPRIERLTLEIERNEAERTQLVAGERRLVERIREGRRRIELLEQQLQALHAREREEAGPLSGSWSLVLLPVEQRGTFELVQTGTLLSGTYRLDGGWTGSLQGTLVNRKVYLVRIDSKLGRSMEFEGYLSSDGKQIRGSWLNYELAGGEGSTGQWSARKRSAP
jgi:hypothetical protein